jgi:DNA replication licensing factor MCM2
LEQEVPLEQLSDIKAKSIVEWIANDRVRRSIVKHFRQFLMTYVDDHGASVYGQRIRNLGESTSFLALQKVNGLSTPPHPQTIQSR